MTNATAFSPAPVASRTVDPPSATASGALDLPAATAPLARGDHLGVIDDILTGSSTEDIDEREPEAEDLDSLHRRPLRWDGLPPVGPNLVDGLAHLVERPNRDAVCRDFIDLGQVDDVTKVMNPMVRNCPSVRGGAIPNLPLQPTRIDGSPLAFRIHRIWRTGRPATAHVWRRRGCLASAREKPPYLPCRDQFLHPGLPDQVRGAEPSPSRKFFEL